MTNKIDGRMIFVWRGKDQLTSTDTTSLADAIAATGEFFNHNDRIVRLDGDGRLVPVLMADLPELIGRHICGVRVVMNNGAARKEYFAYEFPARQRPEPPRQEDWGKPPKLEREPDAKVLEQIYRHELLWRLPKVET